MGSGFFAALFPPEAYALYALNQRAAGAAGVKLCIRLYIEAVELRWLPWEYLYDPHAREYVMLSNSTTLMRCIDLPEPVERCEAQLPLRILGVVGSPSGLPPIDIDLEQRLLEKSLAGLQARKLVELVWLPVATVDQFQEDLRQGNWDAVHFVGHARRGPSFTTAPLNAARPAALAQNRYRKVNRIS